MPIEKVHAYREPNAKEQADLTRRAKAAWFAGGEEVTPDGNSGYVTLSDMGYVVLRSAGVPCGILRTPDTVLAVYRVRSDNLMLRRMKRPPKALK